MDKHLYESFNFLLGYGAKNIIPFKEEPLLLVSYNPAVVPPKEWPIK